MVTGRTACRPVRSWKPAELLTTSHQTFPRPGVVGNVEELDKGRGTR